ncbi:MAG: DNA-directed RNA polymerase subunit A'' [Thermoprotei archaeon]|nr:MAG: DNA-directed RNA polymerase subunit A'' [Thermoprotei archaeon]
MVVVEDVRNKVLTIEEIEARLALLEGQLPRKLIEELLSELSKRKVTGKQLEEVIREILRRFRKALVDPGEAVGIVGAQSIGEPSTQMILRSFHFAGIRAFSMALSLPRLIEIVDARKKPSIPSMTVYLDEEHRYDLNKAREIAQQIQLTTIENVARSTEIDYVNFAIVIELDPEILRDRGLTVEDVKKALEKAKGRGGEVEVQGYTIIFRPAVTDLLKLRKIRDRILNLRLKGLKNVKKAIVRRDEKTGEYYIVTEGTNLAAVLTIPGVDSRRTLSNDIHEVAEVLGIEAARTVIIQEMQKVLEQQGLEVDVRHLMLVADIMTQTGRIRQIGRHGVAGEKPSVLARAAFEVTVHHLVNAAARGEFDELRGVTENVIVGNPIPVGTGLVELLMSHE